MKTVKWIAILSAVAMTAGFVARGDDAESKNQGKANQIIITPTSPDGSAVKSVFERYMKIQAALADDSTKGVSADAAAISKAVKADKTKTLSADVADSADALAQAKDLPAAREAFKDLSQSLIKYLSNRKAHTGELDEVFCPMANAYWLQTNKDISNPYLGHSMPGCGEMKRTF